MLITPFVIYTKFKFCTVISIETITNIQKHMNKIIHSILLAAYMNTLHYLLNGKLF